MIKAVIFDLDGTLADALEGYLYAFREALKRSNLPVMTREDFSKYYGQVDTEIFRRFLNRPKTDDEIQNLAKVKRKLFVEEGIKLVTVIPGAVELVDALFSRKIPMAIASSGRTTAICISLEKMGISDKIKTMVSADDVTNGKPHPEIFIKAAKKLKVPPEECVVFEDSIHGVNAAKAAGIRCIAVATGPTPRSELEKLNPYRVINNMRELLPGLDEFLKE